MKPLLLITVTLDTTTAAPPSTKTTAGHNGDEYDNKFEKAFLFTQSLQGCEKYRCFV